MTDKPITDQELREWQALCPKKGGPWRFRFEAAARAAMPRLVAEVVRLRKKCGAGGSRR